MESDDTRSATEQGRSGKRGTGRLASGQVRRLSALGLAALGLVGLRSFLAGRPRESENAGEFLTASTWPRDIVGGSTAHVQRVVVFRIRNASDLAALVRSFTRQ